MMSCIQKPTRISTHTSSESIWESGWHWMIGLVTDLLGNEIVWNNWFTSLPGSGLVDRLLVVCFQDLSQVACLSASIMGSVDLNNLSVGGERWCSCFRAFLLFEEWILIRVNCQVTSRQMKSSTSRSSKQILYSTLYYCYPITWFVLIEITMSIVVNVF